MSNHTFTDSDSCEPVQFKYWAYISYSHQDSKWADWLHKALERYRVPSRLVGRESRDGKVPKRIFPVFKDREELPGSASLDENINEALRQSRYLIAICSPRSAVSRWVNAEITTFKALGREDRVLCLIVDGEPNASDKPDSGLLECFPLAVRFQVAPDGQVTGIRTEPIAADARHSKDGKLNAKLKVLAGILGIGYDELRQRDKQRRFRQRAQIASGMLVLLSIAGGFWRWQEQEKVKLELQKTVQEEAADVLNSLTEKPVEALVLAIHATGQSYAGLGIVPGRVQYSLSGAIEIAREGNIYQHRDEVVSVAFSPNGKTIAVGDTKATVWLWDLKSNSVQPLGGHKALNKVSPVYVAFSPDGKTIVSGGQDGTVRLWDLKGNPIGEPFKGHATEVTSVAFSPDGKSIGSGSDDQTVRLWDLAGNPVAPPFRGHEGGASSIAFSPDGKTIASGSFDGWIRLWDLRGTPLSSRFEGHTAVVRSVAFSPDGKTIASGSRDKSIRLWDLEGNAISQPFKGHTEKVMSIAFNPDGKTIASGGADGGVRLWNIELVPALRIKPRTSTSEWIMEPRWEEVMAFGHEDFVQSVAFSPDGNAVISGSSDKTVRIWDLQGFQIGQPLKVHTQEPQLGIRTRGAQPMAFSPHGKIMVSGIKETIRIFDLISRQTVRDFKGHSVVFHLTISPDDKTIASIGVDGNPESNSLVISIRLWDTKGNLVGKVFEKTFNVDEAEDAAKTLLVPSSVALSPDGKTIVVGGTNKTIEMWDLKGNRIRGPFKGHEDVVTSVSFSPDGKVIVSSGEDGTIRLWDLEGNSIGQPFKGHEGHVTSVAFSPDGNTIVSGGRDKRVLLWDVKGDLVAELGKHSYDVISVAFSPDGKTVVSGTEDGTIQVWRAHWQEWLRVACDRLRYHPVLKEPKTDVAKGAKETCQRLVWDKR